MIITRLAAASMLAALSSTTEAYVQGGFQSGPSPGAFYSGGMSYIPSLNRAFLTGIHYNAGLIPHDGSDNDLMQGTVKDSEPSCYLAKIDFDDVASGEVYHTLSEWESTGNVGKHEVCTAVAATKGSDVYAVGSVGPGGIFSDGYPMEGLLSILDKDGLQFIDATLIKSAQDPSKHMIYPLDIIHDFGRKYIYIAALTSTDAKENAVIGNEEMPNWIEQHKLGSSYDVTVIKIHAPFGEKPSALWVQHFPLDAEPDGTRPPVFVAGMALQRDLNGLQHLLVSGSTRGSGEAFGRAAPDSVDSDGFIMQLALKDGSFIKHDRHKGTVYNYQDDLREGTPSDDFIKGMCNNRGRGHTEDRKSNDFYIVGGTKGDMTTNDQGVQNTEQNSGFQFGAGVENKYKSKWNREESMMPFLRKVSITDLKPVWTTQWAAMPPRKSGSKVPTNAYAMDCYLDLKGAIYVVGSVLDDAVMTQGDVEMINQGGNDVWVAKIDESTGNVFWLTQLGSMDTEKLARNGSIIVNNEGNVVIFGDTNGSMYRPRVGEEDPDNYDSFLMTIDGETGAVLDQFYMGGTSSASVAASIDGVSPVVTGSTNGDPTTPLPGDNVSTPAPTSKAITHEKKKDKAKKEQKTMEYDKKGNSAGLVVLILFLVCSGLAALYFVCNRQMNKRKAETQKSSIFACLQQFDVEDIDLRRSPPGGWHGTYMNKLAYGQNNAEGDDDVVVDSTDAPLTHSSVVKDSLFMDSNDSGFRDNANFNIDDSDEVDVRLNSKLV